MTATYEPAKRVPGRWVFRRAYDGPHRCRYCDGYGAQYGQADEPHPSPEFAPDFPGARRRPPPSASRGLLEVWCGECTGTGDARETPEKRAR